MWDWGPDTLGTSILEFKTLILDPSAETEKREYSRGIQNQAYQAMRVYAGMVKLTPQNEKYHKRRN